MNALLSTAAIEAAKARQRAEAAFDLADVDAWAVHTAEAERLEALPPDTVEPLF